MASSEPVFEGVLGECWAVLAKQRADWNAGDVEAFMTGYAAAEETTFVSGNAVKRGYDAVLGAYRQRYATRAMGVLSFTDVQLRQLGDSVVLATGRFTVQPAAGQDASGLFSLVLVKNGVWRIVHDHTHST